MAKTAYLVLEDGSAYKGAAFGAGGTAYGEVVFNTSMTGYQEVLSDPSYAGQIVVLTYPLVGNYGVNERDFESRKVQVTGLIVREHCESPSHGLSTGTLHEFLESQGIPGISEVDTRAITRRLRTRGVMMGSIASVGEPLAADGVATEEVLANLKGAPQYGETDFVRTVTTAERYNWDTPSDVPVSDCRILITDLGVKYNIMRILRSRGCQVMAVPASTPAEEMLALKPSGVVLSPGPGDPALLEYAVDNARKLIGKVPILGICLGHQIVARALRANTFKLKFGHRGANHPVKDQRTGRVYITSQNHGYAVHGDSLPTGLEVSYVNLNDGTVEGLTHHDLPLLTIQYHSEASPGPLDNEYIFDRFLEMVDQHRS